MLFIYKNLFVNHLTWSLIIWIIIVSVNNAGTRIELIELREREQTLMDLQ